VLHTLPITFFSIWSHEKYQTTCIGVFIGYRLLTFKFWNWMVHTRPPDLTLRSNVQQLSVELRWTHRNAFFPLYFPAVVGGYSDAGGCNTNQCHD
jgi:hypothetical protein